LDYFPISSAKDRRHLPPFWYDKRTVAVRPPNWGTLDLVHGIGDGRVSFAPARRGPSPFRASVPAIRARATNCSSRNPAQKRHIRTFGDGATSLLAVYPATSLRKSPREEVERDGARASECRPFQRNLGLGGSERKSRPRRRHPAAIITSAVPSGSDARHPAAWSGSTPRSTCIALRGPRVFGGGARLGSFLWTCTNSKFRRMSEIQLVATRYRPGSIGRLRRMHRRPQFCAPIAFSDLAGKIVMRHRSTIAHENDPPDRR